MSYSMLIQLEENGSCLWSAFFPRDNGASLRNINSYIYIQDDRPTLTAERFKNNLMVCDSCICMTGETHVCVLAQLQVQRSIYSIGFYHSILWVLKIGTGYHAWQQVHLSTQLSLQTRKFFFSRKRYKLVQLTQKDFLIRSKI